MTPETPTKPRRERRSMLFPLAPDQLLPLDLKGPKPIAEANRAAHEAVDREREARQDANEAAEQAKAAPRFDELAARAAVEAGEESPAVTAQAKAKRADETRQRAEAAEWVAKQRVRELYDAVEDNFDAYMESRRKPAERAAESVRAIVPEVLERLGAFQDANAIYQAARVWHNNPGSAALFAGAGNLQRQFDRAVGRQAERVRRDSDVPYDLAELLAALARKLEDELEGRS